MRYVNLGLSWQAGVCRLSVALLCSATLAGCHSPRQTLQELAHSNAQQLDVLPTTPFPLLLIAPPQIPTITRLRIYLEGDGRAWATPTQPSLDPSPRNLLVARLAFSDPTPSLYLARPCQFVKAAECKTQLWTDRRFSAEVLASLDQALSYVKTRYGNEEFELIGYSGGGALALLLAAHRNDVTQVQTLAGNLAPREWVRQQRLKPLNGSLEPLDFSERLRNLPQRHLAGRDDKIVPSSLLLHYRAALGQAGCIETRVIPAVDHVTGWEQTWQAWRASPFDCSAD